VVVDGVRLASDSMRLGSDGFLSDLDPSTIESVTFMKGPAAARLYGPNAKRVWLITTKHVSAHQ
jgi:outer membrane receptor protein involved in Fe transport